MKIKIANTVDITSFEAARAGKIDTHIYFTIDGLGPFEVVLPKEDATEQKIQEAINTFTSSWKKITSMEWEV